MKLPFSTLVACGSRMPLGWDHTNMKWYYPIWPELDDKLRPSDKSKMRWRLDWEDEDGHDSETTGISFCKMQEQPELVMKQGPGKDVQTIIE